MRNLIDFQLTPNQTKLLSGGLKFIHTPVTKENQIWQQLLKDFFICKANAPWIHFSREE